MRQDDFNRQPICRQVDRVRASVIASMLLFYSFNYAQEAGFVSFISDTDLDNAIICSRSITTLPTNPRAFACRPMEMPYI